MKFYPGIHQPHHAGNLDRSFISINRLRKNGRARKSDFPVNEWILDSGAFTHLNKELGWTQADLDRYALEIKRWSACGNLVAACAQDYMCEEFMFREERQEWWRQQQDQDLEENADYYEDEWPGAAAMIEAGAWGLDDYDVLEVIDHQALTVERYKKLLRAVRATGCQTHIMPVLQGYTADEYIRCIDFYEASGRYGGEELLPQGAYVAVGSICKRNGNPEAILEVLTAIKARRPDLKLHGFGLKKTALEDPEIRALLESSDSMAWSFAARYEGRDGNDWREAEAYADKVQATIDQAPVVRQLQLF